MGPGQLKLDNALRRARRLYFDAAPLIYWVESYAAYIAKMDRVIATVETSPLQAVTSVLTLAEVMAQPLRVGNTGLARQYRDVLIGRDDYTLELVTAEIAISAGEFRARYGLRTPDAIHAATAIASGCDAFLTNDHKLRVVQELDMLVLDDLEL